MVERLAESEGFGGWLRALSCSAASALSALSVVKLLDPSDVIFASCEEVAS